MTPSLTLFWLNRYDHPVLRALSSLSSSKLNAQFPQQSWSFFFPQLFVLCVCHIFSGWINANRWHKGAAVQAFKASDLKQHIQWPADGSVWLLSTIVRPAFCPPTLPLFFAFHFYPIFPTSPWIQRLAVFAHSLPRARITSYGSASLMRRKPYLLNAFNGLINGYPWTDVGSLFELTRYSLTNYTPRNQSHRKEMLLSLLHMPAKCTLTRFQPSCGVTASIVLLQLCDIRSQGMVLSGFLCSVSTGAHKHTFHSHRA